MKRILLGLLLCVFYQGYSQLSLAPFASGITNLVDIASCGDQRIFLVQRSGVILIADSNGTMHSTPFLDIQSRVHATGLEPGLLSMTFAPILNSQEYFMYYTQINTYHNIITRFRVSADPDVADTSSEQIIIDVSTTTTHLGGDMAFGKDGYLYIGLGMEEEKEIHPITLRILLYCWEIPQTGCEWCCARRIYSTGYQSILGSAFQRWNLVSRIP